LIRSCSERFGLGAAQLVLKLKQAVSTCLSGLCTEAATVAGAVGWHGLARS
jgi:hypothetical protein